MSMIQELFFLYLFKRYGQRTYKKAYAYKYVKMVSKCINNVPERAKKFLNVVTLNCGLYFILIKPHEQGMVFTDAIP